MIVREQPVVKLLPGALWSDGSPDVDRGLRGFFRSQASNAL